MWEQSIEGLPLSDWTGGGRTTATGSRLAGEPAVPRGRGRGSTGGRPPRLATCFRLALQGFPPQGLYSTGRMRGTTLWGWNEKGTSGEDY